MFKAKSYVNLPIISIGGKDEMLKLDVFGLHILDDLTGCSIGNRGQLNNS